MIASRIPSFFKQRVKRRLGVPDHESTLRRMRTSGFSPRTVIDVGAYHGDWTRVCKRVFPDCHVLMIEPQPDAVRELELVTGTLGGVSVAPYLLGAVGSTAIQLHGSGTNASVLREHGKEASRIVELQMRTLDELIMGTRFSHPDLIKLDVQGYELEVLKGAAQGLACAQALVLEVSLLPLYDDCPLLSDVLGFMEQAGFTAFDACGLIRRPLDDALWQIDLMFVRTDSPLRTDRRWR